MNLLKILLRVNALYYINADARYLYFWGLFTGLIGGVAIGLILHLIF